MLWLKPVTAFSKVFPIGWPPTVTAADRFRQIAERTRERSHQRRGTGCPPYITPPLAPVLTSSGGTYLRGVLKRFFAYGCAGWIAEILFTGVLSTVQRKDRSATAQTYLWMHPIYGLGGLALEWLSGRLRTSSRPARALAYLPVIYGIELSSGWLLRKTL